MKFLQLARGWCMGLVDRESHVLSWWTEDPDRCRPAGDFEIEFATKPVLAQRMLAGRSRPRAVLLCQCGRGVRAGEAPAGLVRSWTRLTCWPPSPGRCQPCIPRPTGGSLHCRRGRGGSCGGAAGAQGAGVRLGPAPDPSAGDPGARIDCSFPSRCTRRSTARADTL